MINDQTVNNHAVIILASGLSQRLGQSKQLLNKHGESLIVHMIKLALTTQPKAIVVVIPKDKPEITVAITTLSNELDNRSSSVVTVVNPTPETGMAHSLYLGIEALTVFESTQTSIFNDTFNNTINNSAINRVLIMGVDQVLLDSRHLTNLLAGMHPVTASRYHFLNEQNLNDDLSADEFKKDIVGLPIVIDYECLNQWQSALTGDKGLRHLIRALPSDQISTISNQQLSYDIDTPQQLAYAQLQGWLDS